MEALEPVLVYVLQLMVVEVAAAIPLPNLSMLAPRGKAEFPMTWPERATVLNPGNEERVLTYFLLAATVEQSEMSAMRGTFQRGRVGLKIMR